MRLTKYGGAIISVVFISVTIEIKLHFGEELGYLGRMGSVTKTGIE